MKDTTQDTLYRLQAWILKALAAFENDEKPPPEVLKEGRRIFLDIRAELRERKIQ